MKSEKADEKHFKNGIPRNTPFPCAYYFPFIFDLVAASKVPGEMW